jgi:hypothetical protein
MDFLFFFPTFSPEMKRLATQNGTQNHSIVRASPQEYSMSLESPLLCDKAVSWSTLEERRERVIEHHRRGEQLTAIASKLHVSRKTIQRDCIALGLETYSSLSDNELAAVVLHIVKTLHSSVGVLSVEAALTHRGFRIQEKRIMDALVHLNAFIEVFSAVFFILHSCLESYWSRSFSTPFSVETAICGSSWAWVSCVRGPERKAHRFWLENIVCS